MRRMRSDGAYTITEDEGWADLTARKGGKTRRIQVKEFSSRAIESPEVARRRARSHPHNGRGEIWVYEKNGRRYIV